MPEEKVETHRYTLNQDEARLIMRGLSLLQAVVRELNGKTQPPKFLVPGQEDAASEEVKAIGRLINQFYW